jgi:mannose-1-phosphate guanylyltransferase
VHGRWTDIGNPQAYREACRWMLEQMPGTKISGRLNIKDARVTGPIEIGHDVSLGSNSAIVGPIVIGENTTIGDNVLIGPYTSIGSNCKIGNNSRILSSYIFNNVEIGENNAVSSAIIDNSTRVKDSCILETGTVIGPRVIIGEEVTVNSMVRIWPEVRVKNGTKVSENLGNEDFGNNIKGS